MKFEKQLEIGKTGESLIALWLRSRGWSCLPVYEKIIDEGKGPQLFTPDAELVAPDILVHKGQRCFWIEAKQKTAFSWHRKTGRWVTGIDIRHYEDYLIVDSSTPWPVYLMFLQCGGMAKDSPSSSPSGLFCNSLENLKVSENHRHDGWGRSGMVYWSINALQKIAELDEVIGVTMDIFDTAFPFFYVEA